MGSRSAISESRWRRWSGWEVIRGVRSRLTARGRWVAALGGLGSDQRGSNEVDGADEVLGNLARARLPLIAAENLEPPDRGDDHQDGEQDESAPQERARPESYLQGLYLRFRGATRGCVPSFVARPAKSLRPAVGHEDVAEPPHGLDVGGMRGILLHELPQARDLHVDRAVEHFVLAAARELHQLVARQRRPRIRDEDLEQGELARGERQRLAVALERARGEVDRHAPEADLFRLDGGGGRGGGGRAAGEHRVDGGEPRAAGGGGG